MSDDWRTEFEMRCAEQERAAAEVAERARAAALDMARRKAAEADLLARIENEIIRPFLQAADSPAGRAAASPLTRTRPGLFVHRTVQVGLQWNITLSDNWMADTGRFGLRGRVVEKLDIYSTGLWSMERLIFDVMNATSRYDHALWIGRSEGGLYGRSERGPISPELFDAIRNAVLDYMVSRNIQPK